MPKLVPIVSTSANRDASVILELIAEFQRCARAAVSSLKKQTRTKDLLSSWRKGQIHRAGKLIDPKGRYEFHGAGCRFGINQRLIDVDFGPHGRHDGFDQWKLQQFAQSSFEWSDIRPDAIKSGLKALQAQGIVCNPELEPSPNLSYLSEDIEPTIAPARQRTRLRK